MKPRNFQFKSSRGSILADVVVVSFAMAGASFASVWTGTAADGNWDNLANWDSNPSGGNGEVNTLTNIPIITAPNTLVPNDLKIAVTNPTSTGQVDIRSGDFSINYWAFIGDWAGSGTLNIADTSTSGGTFTGFGTGSGSFTNIGNGNGNLMVGLYNSTGVVNMNTTGSLNASVVRLNPNSPAGSATFNLDNGTVTTAGNFEIGSDFWGTNTSPAFLNMSGGAINAGSELWVAGSGPGTAVVTGGTISSGAWFVVGRNNGSNGTLNMSGGTVNAATTNATAFTAIGSFGGAQGTLNLSGNADFNSTQIYVGEGSIGTMTVADSADVDMSGGMQVGRNNGGNGTFTQSGGTVDMNGGGLVLGRFGGSSGTATISGGTMTTTEDSAIGYDGSGTLTVSGTGTFVSPANKWLFVGRAADVSSTINLNTGGIFEARHIERDGNGSATFNFDGGTFRVNSPDDTMFDNYNENNINVYVRAGGAIIDTNGFSKNVGTELLEDSASTGGGLSIIGGGKLTLAGGDNTYTGTTTVSSLARLGGSGSLAGPLVLANDAEFDFVNTSSTDNLELKNGLALGAGNYMTFEVGGANADRISITGGTYTAPADPVKVYLQVVSPVAVGARTLISGASGIDVSDFDLISAAPVGYEWELQVSGNDLQLVISSLSPVAAFWKGGQDQNWSSPDGAGFNWAQDDSGTSSTVTGPGLATNVTFSASGAANETTILGANFEINSLAYDASAGNVTIGGDPTEELRVNYGITNNSLNSQVINVPVTLGFSQAIATATADITFNSAVTAYGDLSKTGTSKLTLNNDLTVSGAVQVNGGILNPAGTVSAASLAIATGSTTGTVDLGTGTVNIGGVTHVGYGGNNTTTQNGTLNVSGGTWNTENDLVVGFAGTIGSKGTLNITGTGTVNVASTALRWMILGNWDAVESEVNVTAGGKLNLNAGTNIRCLNSSGAKTINVDGGTIDGAFAGADYYMWLGNGTLTVKNSGQFTDWGRIDLGTGTLNIESGGLVEALAGVDAWDGYVNIKSGGVLEAAWVASGSVAGAGGVNIDGGTIRATMDNATYFNFWDNAVGVTIGAGGATVDTNGFSIAGNKGFAGNGGLTKTGAGTLSMGGVSSYTGNTTVSAGTLAANGSSLSDTGTLTISTGAVVNVTGTEVVAALDFGGGPVAAGTYGATGSGAANIDNVHFSGTGVIQVGSVAAGFESWITGFGLAAADQDPGDDPDHDGASNLLEYALGRSPAVSEGAASIGNRNGANFDLTFQRGDTAVTNGDVSIFVEYGNNLTGWTQVAVPAASGVDGGVTFNIADGAPNDTVVASIPTSSSTQFFARVKVVK